MDANRGDGWFQLLPAWPGKDGSGVGGGLQQNLSNPMKYADEICLTTNRIVC
jgi:hypothetical protein